MSEKEAASKTYELPPTGKYLTNISDISLEEVKKQGPNFGKPYWKMTLTVDEGPYAGTPIITTIMLFEGSLYSLKQLCEAVHPEYLDGDAINLPSLENGVPDPDVWQGQQVQIKGTKFAEGTKRGNTGEFREFDEFRVKFLKTEKSGNKSSIAGLPLPS